MKREEINAQPNAQPRAKDVKKPMLNQEQKI
jgi:hypothetical protein